MSTRAGCVTALTPTMLHRDEVEYEGDAVERAVLYGTALALIAEARPH